MSHALDLADLDSLIAELTVDAYGDEEQLTGLLTGAEDALSAGETATVVGVPVQITAVTAGPDVRRGLIAVCERGGERHEISLADLSSILAASSGAWPPPTAAGSDAIPSRSSRLPRNRLPAPPSTSQRSSLGSDADAGGWWK